MKQGLLTTITIVPLTSRAAPNRMANPLYHLTTPTKRAKSSNRIKINPRILGGHHYQEYRSVTPAETLGFGSRNRDRGFYIYCQTNSLRTSLHQRGNSFLSSD